MNKEDYDEDFYFSLVYGIQLYRANRLEDAINHFLSILSKYPDSLELQYNTAIVYMKSNNYAAAAKHLLHITKSMDLEPDDFQANVWSLLGICNIHLKSLTKGIEAFQKTAKINPSFRSQEITYLKKFIQGTTELSSDLFHELGDCYFELGNDFHAEEMYMKALEFGDYQTTVVEALAQVYERIHTMKKHIMLIHPQQSMPSEPLPDLSIKWMQAASFPLEDSDEIIQERRKRWETYFVNGNHVLEIQWHNKLILSTRDSQPIYDGILLLIRESYLSTFNLLNMLKDCFKWIHHTGKIIIIIESPDNKPISIFLKNILETILNSAGWTIKETNALENEDSYYVVSQKTNYEILWRSPLFNSSGYAEEQNHFLDALRPYPLRIKVDPMDSPPSLDLYPSAMKTYLMSLQTQQIKSPLIHYQAAPATDLLHPVAPISIARTMFETNTIHESWVEILNEMTEIWVPSEFNRETFASAGVKDEKIKILPEPLDENKYNPLHVLPYPLQVTTSFKFLSVFDWSPRKGWEVLLRAYFEEFSEDDDVSLILKVSKINEPNTNPYTKIKQLTTKLGLKKLPHIHIIQDYLSQEEMISLYAAVDCFVLPSRGEGWGRPYMEAMAMELPTIGTRWSGQQAFMKDDNSYLINIDGLIPVDPNGMPAHFHGHKWADPSVDHLKFLMRYVYEHPEEAKKKGLKARKDLFPQFSRHTIGKQIYQRMTELVNQFYK